MSRNPDARKLINKVIEAQHYSFWAQFPDRVVADEFALAIYPYVDYATVDSKGRVKFDPYPGKFNLIKSYAIDFGGEAFMRRGIVF